MAIEKDLIKALKQEPKQKGYEATATVVRVESGTAYVHFEDGVEETPASMAMDCKKGDKVKVKVENGKATVTGNLTAPATDDTKANAAHSKAEAAGMLANDASKLAKEAQASAEEATKTANRFELEIAEAEARVAEAEAQVGQAKKAVEDLAKTTPTKTEVSQSIDEAKGVIRTEVANIYATQTAVGKIQSSLEQTATDLASAIEAKVSTADAEKTYATKTEVKQSVDSLTTAIEGKLSSSDAADTYATKTAVKQTTDAISTEVGKKLDSTTAASTYATQSSLKQTADTINSTVSKKLDSTTAASTYATKTSLTQTSEDLTSQISSTNGEVSTLKQTVSGFEVSIGNAQSAAEVAQSTADDAATAASNAQSTADTASTNASSALTKANSAASDASTAKSNASTALSTANTAKSAADTAQSTANTAKTNAATAQSTANTAKSTADTASSNASSALSKANAAASDASTAKTNAATAQTTANAAKTAAADAAKTATNYLGFSDAGLVVGDMTASTLGRNVLIDSDSVDIRSGSDVLASFGEEVMLGKDGNTHLLLSSNGVNVFSKYGKCFTIEPNANSYGYTHGASFNSDSDMNMETTYAGSSDYVTEGKCQTYHDALDSADYDNDTGVTSRLYSRVYRKSEASSNHKVASVAVTAGSQRGKINIEADEINLFGGSYGLSNPAKFRSAIGAGTSNLSTATNQSSGASSNGSSAYFTIGNILVCCNYVSITPTANSVKSKNFTWAKKFKYAPYVVCSCHTSVPFSTVKGVGVDSITASGGTAYIYRTNTTATCIQVMAIGIAA